MNIPNNMGKGLKLIELKLEDSKKKSRENSNRASLRLKGLKIDMYFLLLRLLF